MSLPHEQPAPTWQPSHHVTTEFRPGNVAPLLARIAELDAQLAKAQAQIAHLEGVIRYANTREVEATARFAMAITAERRALLKTQTALMEALGSLQHGSEDLRAMWLCYAEVLTAARAAVEQTEKGAQ
jgi:hypothetical protein